MEHQRRRARRAAWFRAAGYTLLAAAGVAAIALPSPNVRTASGAVLTYVWASFMFAGGGLSAFGAFTDRWLGEYAGLPLLIVVFGVYAVTTTVGVVAYQRWYSIAGSVFLLGIGLILLARWQNVAAMRRDLDAEQRRRR